MMAPIGRVLLVCYAFPPVGGAGVQRVTKFVKYLPAFGWLTSVLAPSNASMPMLDDSLGSDIPPDTVVRRARTLEPSYAVKNLISAASGQRASRVSRVAAAIKTALRGGVAGLLQPDPQVLWYPAAVREGRQLLSSLPHSAIMVSGPPFSSFLIGTALQKSSGLPLVLDYRDEWGLTNEFQENKGFGSLARRLNRRMEYGAARKASAVIATTASSADGLARMVRAAGGQAQALCIPNGFDPDDFAGPAPLRTDGGYCRLLYTGTLWNLTSVAPLVDAVTRLSAASPALAEKLELVFVGRRTADQDDALARLGAFPVRLVQHAYVDHDAAIRQMRSADLLCALLTDRPGAERVLPGKIFEYMACRKPILAIAPPGDLWSVLDDYPASMRFAPTDVSGIAACLARRIESVVTGTREPPVEWDGRRFDRREQARALAEVLSGLAPSGAATDPQAHEASV